jgi:hypothetical protein
MRRLPLVLVGLTLAGLLAPTSLGAVTTPDGIQLASTATDFPPGTFFAVDQVNNLYHFHVAAPGVLLGVVAITGLDPGEDILAIDFRPATGQLYGLGSNSQLYVINLVTGAASPVGGNFTPALSGTAFGFDFNPTVDRIRVVSNTEQNLRLNPDTGQVAGSDVAINPAGSLVASAYTNNFAGAVTTVLYGIDSGTDQLVIQNPPNDGTVTPVGSLGVDTTELSAFDIAPGTGLAYAALTPPASGVSSLYTINLSTGAATLGGAIFGFGTPVRGMAIVAGPELVFGVTTTNDLVSFYSSTPGTIIGTLPITGLQPGESILGIDFRPATGELYGLGSTSRIYRINTANGVAAQVGTGTLSTPLNGTDFGFDFNPTIDRIRVVSDGEQSMAINPDTAAVAVSATLNPPGNVVAAAYTNNFAGATSTTLYDLDSVSDLLLTQVPATGALTAVGPLGVNASGLTGFDISPTGVAFASITLNAASTTNFYVVNLGTGAASLVATIGGGAQIRDTAVRLRAEVLYGLTVAAGPTHNLVRFNAATPSIIISTVAITGLQAGETLLGIDFRPAAGQLYGLGSTSRLYTINAATGVATQVGTGQLSTLLSGTNFGFDFNPSVDRIRVVSDAEQNIALNPNSAAVTVNNPLNPAGNVVAAAYSNNFAGATSTTLYDIDSTASTLSTQVPATGALTVVGTNLGISISNGNVGFDIASGTGNPYLSAYMGGSSPGLYRVNLSAGTATLIGTINVTDTLVDISVQIEGPAVAGGDTPGSYISAGGSWFLRNSSSPGSADAVFTYGAGGPTMIPIKGDWDGDGDDTIGIYDSSSGAFFLRNANSPGPAEVPIFTFGPGGVNFVPIAGDWDGDGDDTVGLYDSGSGNFFLRNTNANGGADLVFTFGVGGAIPLAGDWNNDNTDTIGIYHASSGTFFLRNSNTNGPADITPFSFGAPNRTPVAGDWNSDGTDTIGVYDPATAVWFLSNGFTGTADFGFSYGPAGSAGLVGDWDGQ